MTSFYRWGNGGPESSVTWPGSHSRQVEGQDTRICPCRAVLPFLVHLTVAFHTALSALLRCPWALPWQHTHTPPGPSPQVPARRCVLAEPVTVVRWGSGGWAVASPGSASPPAAPELPRPLSHLLRGWGGCTVPGTDGTSSSYSAGSRLSSDCPSFSLAE